MAMSRVFNHIVIGVGGIGSGVLYWLSKLSSAAGKRSSVLGIEQFKLGHDNGSSQDISRIMWGEVERESGIKLVTKTGGLFFTFTKDGHLDVVEEYAKSMTEEGVRFDRLDGKEIAKRFPQFNTAHEEVVGLFNKDCGFVNAALGNAVHTQLALKHGAEIIQETKVHKIEPRKDHVTVHTNKGVFEAEKLIIACGAWNNDLLKHFDMEVSITCTKEQVTYFGTPNIRRFLPESFPVWLCHGKTHDYYGIPINPGVNAGIKIGVDAAGDLVHPDTRTFEVNEERLTMAKDFIRTVIPEGYGPPLYTKTCLYELTPDRHFILDSLACRGHPNVQIFMGCGHGFKFASLVGKIFAQIALTGQTEYPLSPSFQIDRPALQMMNAKGNIMFGKKSQLPV